MSTDHATEKARGVGAPAQSGGKGGSNLALPVGGKGPSPLPETQRLRNRTGLRLRLRLHQTTPATIEQLRDPKVARADALLMPTTIRARRKLSCSAPSPNCPVLFFPRHRISLLVVAHVCTAPTLITSKGCRENLPMLKASTRSLDSTAVAHEASGRHGISWYS